MNGIPIFHVRQPGLLTTVQDRGRLGHQRDGMVVAGAMDPFAAQVANILVGNGRGEAVLEITLTGPTLEALEDVGVAVCGADLSAQLDGERLPLWRGVRVRAGQTLRFGAREAGARAYLAVAGGFNVPVVMGSQATYLRGGIGGLEGRALRAGDGLQGVAEATGAVAGRALAEPPDYTGQTVLRVMPGPHGACFAPGAWGTLVGSEYELTPRSDRMGLRLNGPPLAFAPEWGGSLLSEAAPLGGIQVPPEGQPIALMADRQTTGGYPLIGVVIAADVPRLAQSVAGDIFSFAPVSLEEAQDLAVAQERMLRLLEWAAHGLA